MLYICEQCSEYKDADMDAPYESPTGDLLCPSCAEELGYDTSEEEEDQR